MDGFEVTTEMVATAGEAAGRIAGVVTGLDVAAPVAALGNALSGGRTALVAAQVGPTWASGVGALGAQARQHADALGATANAYRDTDLTGAASLSTNAPATATRGGRPAMAGSVRAI